MEQKLKIDPENDQIVQSKDHMTKEEVERYGKSVESEMDQMDAIDDLNNLIK